MNNVFYIFLDIDGVLNNSTYTISRYNIHHKPMSMDYTPFDPECLNNLFILFYYLKNNNFEPRVVLSSSWRLNDISIEIVKSRLAEYGVQIYDKTKQLDTRGQEIQDYLSDRNFKDFIIIDDEDFDIKDLYPSNLIKTDDKCGFSKEKLYDALNCIKNIK